MKHLSTVIITVSLLLVPLAIWSERTDQTNWNNPLFFGVFEDEPNRHTPIKDTGQYLPAIIDQDLTLTPQGNPYFISGTVTITPGTTLSITAGSQILVHEFGHLINQGTLNISGAATRAVVMTTNELHPLNQTWNGITSAGSSTTTIKYAHISYASPGISCLPLSQTSLEDSLIELGNLGVFADSPNCLISNNVIKSLGDGIIYSDPQLDFSNNFIDAARIDIKQITDQSIL